MSASIVTYLPNQVLVGQPTVFQICTTATPPEQGQIVNVYVILSNPAQRTQFLLEYYDTTTGTYQPMTFNSNGVAIYGPGPPGGFPLENICSTFRITFFTPDRYTFTLEVKRASDGAVLASTSQTVVAVTTTYLSTGSILNSGLVPSTNLEVLINNNDTIATVIVELEVFEITKNFTGSSKVGAVHQLFSLPPLSVATRTANITGFPAYEMQVGITGANVVVDTFMTDTAGNLNAAQRTTAVETTPIANLTPLP